MGIMEQPGFFDAWLKRAGAFTDLVQQYFDADGFPAVVQRVGCNFFIYIGTRQPITNYSDYSRLNQPLAQAFYRKCIEKGVYFHTDFTVSAMHDEETLTNAAGILREAARQVQG
jgi:glutamate-1-semialdehyde 2,1-aminomutase